MVAIFNKTLDVHIKIPHIDWIVFSPREYEETPNVVIECKNGFNFLNHSRSCPDCEKFLKAFGTKSLNWYITYDDVTRRLDLSTLNSKEYYNNQIKFSISEYDYGTKMKLIIHPLSIDEKDIEDYLNKLVENEEYETACLVRDIENPS